MSSQVLSLDEFIHSDSTALAGTVLQCPECGREHSIPIKRMKVGSGMAGLLPDLAQEILGKKPHKTVLIYDRVIEQIIRETFSDIASELNIELIPLGKPDYWLDSTDILGDRTADRIKEMGADLIIGAGSGVIADLTKWAATKTKVPFILYGTAASMNAHASITATMTRNGVKVSEWLDPAEAVLMDSDIISKAPKPMRLAGLGDLVARSICNADWLLGHLIREKSFCPVPYMLTGPGEQRYLSSAAGIGSGDPSATQVLSEASLVSAVSMTMMAGETSPSSGAEHVFSHFWDLQTKTENAPKNLHGIQVGLGTLLSFSLWEYMRDLDVSSIDPEALLSARSSLESIIADNEARFGTKAVLFNEAVRSKWISDENYVEYLDGILKKWPDIWNSVSEYVGNSDSIRKALAEAGFELNLSSINRSRQQALDAINFGARYRSRYTMLDLASELGVLPSAAEEILDRSGL